MRIENRSFTEAERHPQVLSDLFDGRDETLTLPPPDQVVYDGVQWGLTYEIPSPAFWAAQVWYHRHDRTFDPAPLGRNLAEEVSACLLGGYGMPAEPGWAAFLRLRADGLIARAATESELLARLLEPLDIKGRAVRYRFPKQKARYLAAALKHLRMVSPRASGRTLRSELLQIPGIGMKTASWVV